MLGNTCKMALFAHQNRVAPVPWNVAARKYDDLVLCTSHLVYVCVDGACRIHDAMNILFNTTATDSAWADSEVYCLDGAFGTFSPQRAPSYQQHSCGTDVTDARWRCTCAENP